MFDSNSNESPFNASGAFHQALSMGPKQQFKAMRNAVMGLISMDKSVSQWMTPAELARFKALSVMLGESIQIQGSEDSDDDCIAAMDKTGSVLAKVELTVRALKTATAARKSLVRDMAINSPTYRLWCQQQGDDVALQRAKSLAFDLHPELPEFNG